MTTEEKELNLPLIDIVQEGQLPLDIGRFMYMPNRKVYCFVIRSKNMANTLHEMTELVEKTGAVILYGLHWKPYIDADDTGTSAFIDFTDASVQPEEVAERIRKLDYVDSVKVIPPNEKGFVADNCSFPLRVDGDRAIVLRESLYKSFLVDIRERFGTGGSVFLYYVGYDLGLKAISSHMKFTHSFDTETLIHTAKTFTACMGWAIGEVPVLDMQKKTAVVRLYKSFECELAKNQSGDKPFSQFFRGVIAGVFTKIFDKPITIEETKCIAKGDAYCEFHIQ